MGAESPPSISIPNCTHCLHHKNRAFYATIANPIHNKKHNRTYYATFELSVDALEHNLKCSIRCIHLTDTWINSRHGIRIYFAIYVRHVSYWQHTHTHSWQVHINLYETSWPASVPKKTMAKQLFFFYSVYVLRHEINKIDNVDNVNDSKNGLWLNIYFIGFSQSAMLSRHDVRVCILDSLCFELFRIRIIYENRNFSFLDRK